MNIVLKIALRYLKAKKTHSAVNIISIISVCGVMITTAALVCVLSVFNGFSGLISDKLSKLDPQIKILPISGKVIANADSLISIVNSIEGVTKATPVIEEQALAIYANHQMPVHIKGVSDDYNTFTNIEDVILYGNYAISDEVNNYAILSIGVAAGLQSNEGFMDYLKIYAPKREGKVNIANPMGAFRTDSLYVSAIYQTDQNTYDRDMVYVPISVARRLLNYRKEATSIEVKLAENTDETAIIHQIETTIGNRFSVKDRLMQQASVYKMINAEKWITFLLLSFILVIAAFNVIGSLSLLIIEKDESIRIFRTMGATNRQISSIFVTEGLLISLAGAVGGIILGVILCLIQQELGLIKLAGDANSTIVSIYPVQVVFSDILVVFAIVATVGLVTSLVTALLMRARLKAR